VRWRDREIAHELRHNPRCFGAERLF
jgi:hypothetical protein